MARPRQHGIDEQALARSELLGRRVVDHIIVTPDAEPAVDALERNPRVR